MNSKCACGFRVGGPLMLFEHIQNNHKSENLAKMYKKREVKIISGRYPKIEKVEFFLLESLDDRKLVNQVKKMSQCYSNEDFPSESMSLLIGEEGTQLHKGTWEELSIKFCASFPLE